MLIFKLILWCELNVPNTQITTINSESNYQKLIRAK